MVDTSREILSVAETEVSFKTSVNVWESVNISLLIYIWIIIYTNV